MTTTSVAAPSPMDRAATIELGTDHIFVPVLFHSLGPIGLTISDGKVSEATIEAEKQGVRVQDIIYAISDRTCHLEDDSTISGRLKNAVNSPWRPLKLVFRRESPAFTVECERKKMAGSVFASPWKATNLCLIKGVLTRFEKRTAQDPTDTIALTFDSKVEICESAGKPNAITIVNGNGDDVGTYAFRDPTVMGKVLERIQDSIEAEQRDTAIDVKILPRHQFMHFIAANTVIEGKSISGEYHIGHVDAVLRDASGDIISLKVHFVNGESNEDMKPADVRQPYSSLTHEQAKKLHTQSKEEKEARATSGPKGFKRSMSSKKHRQSTPGWLSAKEAQKIDALFAADNHTKVGQLAKFEDGKLEKNLYAVVEGYLVVFSKSPAELENDAEKMKKHCRGAYRLGEVSHATVDVEAITVNLKYSCGVVVVLKADGMIAAEEWKRALIDEVRQDITALPTAKVAIDVDGDGKVDFVVEGVDADGDGVPDVIQKESKDKVIGLHPDAPIPAYVAEAAVAVDLDGDGVPDVVVYGEDGDGDGIPDVLQAQPEPVVETTISTPVEAGAVKLEVVSSDGFKIGRKIFLCMPGKEDEGEECVVAGFGSLLLVEPTKNAYGAGASVSQVPEPIAAVALDIDGDGIPDVIVMGEDADGNGVPDGIQRATVSRDMNKNKGRMCFCF